MVTVEMLGKNREVLSTKTVPNIVVKNANKIIANVLANPAKTTKVNKTDTGKTSESLTSKGYPFELTVQTEASVSEVNDIQASNQETVITMVELKDIIRIESITHGGSPLTLNKDVFIKDAVAGVLEFAVAPTAKLVVQARIKKNKLSEITEGSQVVTVAGVPFKRAATASDSDKTYAFDPKLGIIYFQTSKDQVSVTYTYESKYTLGFMGVGGLPVGHPKHTPVEFGKTKRLINKLENEFKGARVPLQFPATVTEGEVEIQPSIMTKPIPLVDGLDSGKEVTVTKAPEGAVKTEYSLNALYDSGEGNGPQGRLLHEVKARNTTKSTDLTVTITENSTQSNKVTLDASEISENDVIVFTYTIKLNASHLTYQLAQAPVLELVEVAFRDSLDPTKLVAYEIKANGLNPGEGDVWVSDSSIGEITFTENISAVDSESAPAPKPWTAGYLQVKYRVNSGTTVRFVAEFPEGVPGPVKLEEVHNVQLQANATTILLPKKVARDALTGVLGKLEILIGSSNTPLEHTEYSLTESDQLITLKSAPSSTQATNIKVTYEYLETTAEIYTVGMFDSEVQDDNVANMFNATGIGPIPKDLHTGMRITWAVTL